MSQHLIRVKVRSITATQTHPLPHSLRCKGERVRLIGHEAVVTSYIIFKVH